MLLTQICFKSYTMGSPNGPDKNFHFRIFSLQNSQWWYLNDLGSTIYLVAKILFFQDWPKTPKFGPIGSANGSPSMKISLYKLYYWIKKGAIEPEKLSPTTRCHNKDRLILKAFKVRWIYSRKEF